ncbi:MAG TPA: GPP34 family phosphoprotein [Actinospica sp.]|jgi:hypothetical protein|nr:GPP34 family phosphoprotein [Actinospica sp.]
MSAPRFEPGDVPPSKPETDPVFAPTMDGARAAGDFVAEEVRESGLPWVADRAALATYLQALWLMRNGHPSGPLSVVTVHGDRDRLVRIQVGDGGSGVPEPEDKADALRAVFVEHVDRQWAGETDSGRALVGELAVRRAFRLRSAWRPAEPGPVLYGYADFDDADEAIAAAGAAAGSIGAVEKRAELVAVHLQGPEDGEYVWRRVAPEAADAEAVAQLLAQASEPQLALAQLADLTKIALRACSFDWSLRGEQEPPQDLPTLLRLALPAGRATWTTVRQLARWVAEASPAIGPAIEDPLLSLLASTHSDPRGPFAGLQQRLGAAWMACEDKQQQTSAAAPRDSSELAEQLTIAGSFSLVARDRRTGRALLAPEVSALGTAGALIAEAVLAGHLLIEAAGTLSWTEPEKVVGLSQAALDLVATVRAEGPTPVGRWLDYLALSAGEQVERALLDAGILRRGEGAARRRRGRGDAVLLPAREELVDHVVRLASFPDRNPVEYAVLLALVRATGLHHADRNTWWIAENVSVDQALGAAGTDLPRLIEYVADAVTTAVAVRLR